MDLKSFYIGLLGELQTPIDRLLIKVDSRVHT